MRMDTIYDIMGKLRHERNFNEAFTSEVLGMTVLTDYNNQTYKITDVDFNTTPSSTFEGKNGPISFVEYYREHWKLKIQDPRQPMLIAQAKERQIRGGQAGIILLVPELCRATGLDENMRKNFQ